MKENVFFVVEAKRESTCESMRSSPKERETLSEKIITKALKRNILPTLLRKKTYSDGFHTGKWSEEEHKKFIEGIFMHGNEWRKVQKHVRSRSSAQARSHAQKFFIRLKNKLNFSVSMNFTNESDPHFQELFYALEKFLQSNYEDSPVKEGISLHRNTNNLVLMLCYFHKKIQAERKWKIDSQESSVDFFDKDSIDSVQIKKKIFKVLKTPNFTRKEIQLDTFENLNRYEPNLSEGNVYEKLKSFFNIPNHNRQMPLPFKDNLFKSQSFSSAKIPASLHYDFLPFDYEGITKFTVENNFVNYVNVNPNPFKIEFNFESPCNNNMLNYNKPLFSFEEEPDFDKRTSFFN